MKWLAGFGILALLYFTLWPVPIDPVAWSPDPDPGLTGAFVANEGLAPLTIAAADLGEGPEDVTQGPDGWFYTGLLDGRILRFRDGEVETWADTGGRPLGMQFDAGGALIVADAYRGLISIGPEREVRVLADSYDGEPMLLVDDLDIAADGTIWFSDASRRFPVANWILDFWEGRGTGRLFSYEPGSGALTMHLDGLRFANGVALGPDEAFVLVTETLAARIVRLWLKGPQAGQSDVFIDRLPGYPDNLSYNGRDTFWVAMPALRQEALERLSPYPFARKVLMRLPEKARHIEPGALAWAVGLDGKGEVVASLQNRSGLHRTVTSVNEFDGTLYLGSIATDSVARAPVP